MKKFINIVLVGLILCMSIQFAYAKEDIHLYSEYAYLYDPITSLVYLNQKEEEKIYPASMTKILTVYTALEKIEDIHQKEKITQSDLEGLIEAHASVAGFYVGEVVTYEDLLYGALLPSGADACNALGRLLFGSVDNMVKAMNQKVQELNLTHTHFTNVTGLHDDNHYTTVKDMAKILENALHNKDFQKIFETRTYTSSNQRLKWISSLQRGYEMKGIDTSFIDGGKSGYTDEAQLTFASTMTIDKHQLILVTAKANGQRTQNHVKDVVNVYHYMKDHYQNYTFYKKDDELYDYIVFNTYDMFHTYHIQENIELLLEKGMDKNAFQKELTNQSFFFAPYIKNQQVGEIDIKYNNQSLYKYQFNAYETIERNNSLFIVYGIIVCIPFVIYKKKNSL